MVHQNPNNQHRHPWWHSWLTLRGFIVIAMVLSLVFTALAPNQAGQIISNIFGAIFGAFASVLNSFVAAIVPSYPGLLGLAVVCFAFLCFWIALKNSIRKPPPKKKGKH